MAKGNTNTAKGGAAVENGSGIAVSEQAAQPQAQPQVGATEVVAGDGSVQPVKPIGNGEFIKWYVPLARAGKTLDQMVAAYPGEIEKASFSAKLSKVRKFAAEQGIKLPYPARAAGGPRGEKVDYKSLAAELGLELMTEAPAAK
jgi:hypothetical protein